MKFFRISYKQGKNRSFEVIEAESRLKALKIFANSSLGVMQKVDEISEPFSMKFKKLKKW